MVVHVPTGQIEQYWDVIKKAGLESDCVAAAHEQAYSLVLLQDLLDNTKHCLFGIRDGQIKFVMIYSVRGNKVTGAKEMLFTNLYGFDKLGLEDWQEVDRDVRAIARQAGCSTICADVTSPRAAELLRAITDSVEQTRFSWSV